MPILTPPVLAGKVRHGQAWSARCVKQPIPVMASFGGPFIFRDVSFQAPHRVFCLLPDTATDSIGEEENHHDWSL